MTFTLSIAGLAIRVTEPENRPTVAWPLRPFERFLADNATPPDITHVGQAIRDRLSQRLGQTVRPWPEMAQIGVLPASSTLEPLKHRLAAVAHQPHHGGSV